MGTWQIKRLKWKTDLIARSEDQLVREPLPLPPNVDVSQIPSFDYRRITATGKFRHDQEMLIGPRVNDGENGYLVVTPLERENGSKVLIRRGWISKRFKDHKDRPDGLPTGTVAVEGLLRIAPKKNMFTPHNAPEKGEFYFPDVDEMALITGSQPVWVEETLDSDMVETLRRIAKGIPLGKRTEVQLTNHHSQYIFTW